MRGPCLIALLLLACATATAGGDRDAFAQAARPGPDAPTRDWDKSCLARTGCPKGPAPVPRCPTSARAEAIADVQNAKRLGERVTVHGLLHTGGVVCTLKGCAFSCCNRCSGALDLRDEEGQGRLGLHSADGGFRCSGDESKVCCGLDPPEQPVRATGTLLRGERGRFSLTDATVCRP